MPNENYQKGRSFEYRVRAKLLKKGWPVVLRTAGSHGEFDLIALNKEKKEILLVQCKSGKSKESEISKLSHLAEYKGDYAVWVALV